MNPSNPKPQMPDQPGLFPDDPPHTPHAPIGNHLRAAIDPRADARRHISRLTELRQEWLLCGLNPAYFTANYAFIEDVSAHDWVRFTLWPAQYQVIQRMHTARKLAILKARQLGLSWLSLAYALWLMLFRSPGSVLLFSVREAEAKELLRRLRGIYARLPPWMQARHLLQDSATALELSNGSRALAFATGTGRSYSAALALVDEADFVPDLAQFLNAVKPTVDSGGQLFLVSTSNKRQPNSVFKSLFQRAGARQAGDYEPIFLPWTAHPHRDNAWYLKIRAEMYAQRGTHDDFYAEYPATPEEALAPEQLDRRLPLAWLQACFQGEGHALPAQTVASAHGPPIDGLCVFELPAAQHAYLIAADPAEGNPQSDDSAFTVFDAHTWAEVASYAGKLEPDAFAACLEAAALWYHAAPVMVERNNHGHAVLLALRHRGRTELLNGHDNKPGWLNNVKGKPLMYAALAEALRDAGVIIRTRQTLIQLANIQASDLRAPAGLLDDRAVSFALGVAALARGGGLYLPSTAIPPPDPLHDIDRAPW